MTEAITKVSAVIGAYHVRLRGELHVVNKLRRCSCRRARCPAIQAVAAYLRAGGPRAPEPLVRCPICQAGAAGSLERQDWNCLLDRGHYFQWRVQRLREARQRALHDATPYAREVLTAFASNEARAVFLAKHALTYPAGA